jgi:hypothetical protein
MIPEEMYQTLDETSLEHWLMELPEDEAGCRKCDQSATWRVKNPCGCGSLYCDVHIARERAGLLLDAGKVLACAHCGFGTYTSSDVRFLPA